MTNRGGCSFFCLTPLSQTARQDNLAFIEFAKLRALPASLTCLMRLNYGLYELFLRASKSL